MSDETEEQKKLMRQIDISCVQAFHTMDEIDAMVELAKKYRLAAVFTLPAFAPMWQNGCRIPGKFMREVW